MTARTFADPPIEFQRIICGLNAIRHERVRVSAWWAEALRDEQTP